MQRLVEQYYIDPTSPGSTLNCISQELGYDSLSLGSLLRTFKRWKVYIYPETNHTATQRPIYELQELLEGEHDYPSAIYFEYSCKCRSSCGSYSCHDGHTWCGLKILSGTTKTEQMINHTTTCSVLTKLKAEIKAIVEGVKGLEYSRFVRTELKDNEARPPTGQKPRWDYLDYI